MNKNILAIVLMLLIATDVWAQKTVGKTTFYPRLGENISTITHETLIFTDAPDEKPQEATQKMKTGISLGIEAEHQLAKYFAVSCGLIYSQMGTNYKDGVGGDIYSGVEPHRELLRTWSYNRIGYTLHYLNVPLLGVVNLGNTGVSLKAGVQAGYLLHARYKGELEVYGPSKEDHNIMILDCNMSKDYGSNVTSKFKRFDVSIPVGISYEWKNVCLDIRYNLGLTPTDKSLSNTRNSSFLLTIGYGLQFFKD